MNIDKAILNFTTELFLASSPTNKVVEKGNIIRRIEHNLQKPDRATIRCFKNNYRRNNRKNSVDEFAQGLTKGKYKYLY